VDSVRAQRTLVAYALYTMQADEPFMSELHANRIVPANEEMFARWQGERAQFEAFERKTFTERYAFKSTERSAITWLSHMFLHADWGHLLGNMLALCIIGYIVEELLGKLRYLAFY